MSDYANCPTCHGKGVIPLETAQRIEAHGQVSHDAARQLQRERLAEDRRAEIAWRIKDAEDRYRRFQETVGSVYSAPATSPEQTGRLAERLAALEAEQS
jgi:hypothetical protein